MTDWTYRHIVDRLNRRVITLENQMEAVMGAVKHMLEDKVEKACTCEAGIDLDPEHHAEDCPSVEVIYEAMPSLRWDLSGDRC